MKARPTPTLRRTTIHRLTVTLRAFALTLAACTASAAIAQTPGFPTAEDIAGDWNGVFQCDGYTNQFAITLQHNGQGRLTGPMQRSLLGPTFKKHQQPYEKSLQVIAQYDSRSGTLALGNG
ncbi:MAG: hypothetical protein AAF004_09530 [Pseudomonadota bacterium]